MTKLMRFVGTCLLVVSMAGVAWAGETHGPGLPAPPPPAERTTDGTSTQTTVPLPEASVNTADDVVNVLVTWLVESLL